MFCAKQISAIINFLNKYAMKKTVILILGGAVALTLSLVMGISVMSQTDSESGLGLFEANVEALADIEHWGSCGTTEPYCQARCPECNNLVWAKEYQGPGKLTHCSCSGTMTPIKNPDDKTPQPAN